MVREHIELSGYAKDERVFQSIAKRVRVSVNQTGQERLPFAVDAADAGRRFHVCPYSFDLAVLHPDLASGDYARAIKDAHIADHKLGIVNRWFRRRRLGKQDQTAQQEECSGPACRYNAVDRGSRV